MRIIFFGTPTFAVPSLKTLLQSEDEIIAVITQQDKRRGRTRELSAPPVKEFAIERDINVLQPHNIKDPSFIRDISKIKPDLIVVVAYGKILPKQILQIPAHGCINVHASLLPKYRGAAPIQWALLKGEKITGVTTMFMDENLDTGDILLQKKIEISDDDNAETLSKKLADLGASLLVETIERIKNSSLTSIPQTGIPSYAPPLKREDGKLDWSKTSREIFNFVRGMYPWPGAYCHLNKERIKITKVQKFDGSGVAGRIERADSELVIGTSDGLISIIELQPEGKKPMTAQAFLHGRRLKEGAFFDEP